MHKKKAKENKKLLKLMCVFSMLTLTTHIIRAEEVTTPENPIDEEPVVSYQNWLIKSYCISSTVGLDTYATVNAPTRLIGRRYVKHLAIPWDHQDYPTGYDLQVIYRGQDGLEYDFMHDGYYNAYTQWNYNASHCN